MMGSANESDIKPRSALNLQAYAAAAGAFGVAASPAFATVQPFVPPGGLPITVDSLSGPLDLDIDGDTVADFRLYYLSDYGGGFSIAALNPGDASNGINAFYVATPPSDNPQYWYPVRRYDPTEWVSEELEFNTGTTSPASGYNAIVGHHISGSYAPFANRPGFVALRLQADSGSGGTMPLPPRPAYLEVVISADNEVLRVLSGGYEDNPNANGIELPQTTPPPPP